MTVKYAGHERETVSRLQDELDRMIQIFAHMRESFENELSTEFAKKKLAVTPGMMKTGKELAGMMDLVVGAKIRFDKAQKGMADSMTPEDERKAVMTYIKSLEPSDCSYFIRDLMMWYKGKHEYSGSPI